MLYSGSNPFPSPYGSSLEYFQPHRVTFDPIRTIGITPTAPVRRVVNRTPTTPRQVPGAFGSPTSAQAIRATGDQSQGPNAAYAQNLATYAGGAFKRSGSPMLVNPFGTNPFAGTQSNGLGSSPLPGTPTTLLSAALGQTLSNPQALNSLFPGFKPVGG